MVIGCAVGAVGFGLWASKMPQLSFSSQQWDVILAGAGMGFMLTPASTDAVNRASRLSYGEATGITQTVRNYAASLGLAILGTILVSQLRVSRHLVADLPGPSSSTSGGRGLDDLAIPGFQRQVATIPHFVRLDFALASQTVFYVMAGIMALAALVALVGLEPGLQDEQAGSHARNRFGGPRHPTRLAHDLDRRDGLGLTPQRGATMSAHGTTTARSGRRHQAKPPIGR